MNIPSSTSIGQHNLVFHCLYYKPSSLTRNLYNYVILSFINWIICIITSIFISWNFQFCQETIWNKLRYKEFRNQSYRITQLASFVGKFLGNFFFFQFLLLNFKIWKYLLIVNYWESDSENWAHYYRWWPSFHSKLS